MKRSEWAARKVFRLTFHEDRMTPIRTEKESVQCS